MIRYIEGSSHFVTSVTAPIASGWSEIAGWVSHPLGKRRLCTAHATSGHSRMTSKRQECRNFGHSHLEIAFLAVSKVGAKTSKEKVGPKADRSCDHSQDQTWKQAQFLSLYPRSHQPILHVHKMNLIMLH
jgi:hypothetical protein